MNKIFNTLCAIVLASSLCSEGCSKKDNAANPQQQTCNYIIKDLGQYSNIYGTTSIEQVEKHNKYFQKYCEKFNVNSYLAKSICLAESKGYHINPKTRKITRSSTGALGTMQLTKSTAKHLKVNPHKLDSNIYGGISYLAELSNMFGALNEKDQLMAVIASYNAGPERVENAIIKSGSFSFENYRKYLSDETQEYVPKVLASFQYFGNQFNPKDCMVYNSQPAKKETKVSYNHHRKKSKKVKV